LPQLGDGRAFWLFEHLQMGVDVLFCWARPCHRCAEHRVSLVAAASKPGDWSSVEGVGGILAGMLDMRAKTQIFKRYPGG